MIGTSIIPVVGDLENENVSDCLPERVDYIIHAAASVRHYGCWKYFKRANTENAFLTRVKPMLDLGCLPDYLMPLYSEFSPVDSTAEAIVTLTAIDTGIKDIEYDSNDKRTEFTTVHVGQNGRKYELDLYAESEGTIKSILLFIYARSVIRGSCSVFMDELNVKLHPLLLKFIIDLFYNRESSAQLIYTTHDTALMDRK